jgi:uncharacterized OsmC-like protein
MPTSKVIVTGIMYENFKTDIECSNNFVMDQPKAGGGDNLGPNPLEVFLSSLAGCICAIGRIISNQKRLEIQGIEAKVEGIVDKDYLLGKTKEGRAGFTAINTTVTVKSDMSKEDKEAFVKEIEDRCPIYDNMVNTSKVNTTVI